MEMTCDHVVEVEDTDQVGEARRTAKRLARALGFGPEDEGRLAIAATEVATNLVKHGRGGRVLLGALEGGASRGVRMVAIDRGPGIADIARAMRDGYSSAGTSGSGLGAISRQADAFDLWSQHGHGTVVLAEFRPRPVEPADEGSVGAVCVPVRGEEVCGDGWGIAPGREDGVRTLLVVDGLGHGRAAHQASEQAKRIFHESSAQAPGEIVARMHERMRSTRGAAVAVARLDEPAGEVVYCGIGNLSATILAGGASRSLVSHHGTLGHDSGRIQEFRYPWPPGATLVVNSDGLLSHWELGSYPGLLPRHPGVVASVLYRDFSRGRDDATVVVVRRRA